MHDGAGEPDAVRTERNFAVKTDLPALWLAKEVQREIDVWKEPLRGIFAGPNAVRGVEKFSEFSQFD